MKKTPIRLSHVSLISLLSLVAGCLHRAPSLQMLEDRSEYEADAEDDANSLKLSSAGALSDAEASNVPVRIAPRTANVWIFPHETEAKEYFWGGWITIIVEGDRWELAKPPGPVPAMPPERARVPHK